MSWWGRFRRRAKLEEQLDKELRFHLEQHAADLVERGSDPGEARRQARLAIGGPEQVKESCRDARGTRWLEDLLQALRDGVAVDGAERDHFEDEHVERALREIGFGRHTLYFYMLGRHV